MSKKSSAEYYQDSQKRLQKKLMKDMKVFLKKKKRYKKTHERYESLFKEEKQESDNMVMKDTKIYHTVKNKIWLSIEKNVIE